MNRCPITNNETQCPFHRPDKSCDEIWRKYTEMGEVVQRLSEQPTIQWTEMG